MELALIAFVLFSFFFAALLKGITGLGFSTICLPILTPVIDPKSSIPLVIVPSLMSNALIMIQSGALGEVFVRFRMVYLAAVPGLVIGVGLLHSVDGGVSRMVLGGVMCLYGAWAFFSVNGALSRRQERWLALPTGLCTGVLNGMTGSQVMPLLPYMLSLGLERRAFIQAINLSFTFSSVVMLILLNRYGFLASAIIGLSFCGVAPVGLGIYLGGKLRNHLKQELYRKVVLLLLVGMGISLMARA